MKVRVVETVATENTAGQAVESVPVYLSDEPVDGHAPVTLEEDAAGVPVRIVETLAPENSVGTPVDALVGKWGGGSFDPLDLFANGESGFLYDFSKTDRTLQTAVGETLADDAGEQVGLALEESQWQGKTFAAVIAAQTELAENQTFDDATGWTLLGDFSITGGQLVKANTGATSIAATPIDLTQSLYRLDFDSETNNSNCRAASFVGVGTSPQEPFIIPSGTGHRTGYLQNILGEASVGFYFITSGFGSIDNLSIKKIPGKHGRQPTSAARPTRQTGGVLRFDGVDDNLLTTLVPSASMTLAFKGKVTSASKVVMGSRTGTSDEIELQVDASGFLVGTAGTASATGDVDIRTAEGVYVMTVGDGAITIYAYDASGTLVDTATAVSGGSINTTVPIMIGGRNTSGTGSLFADADITHALAIDRALTAAEINELTNSWSQS